MKFTYYLVVIKAFHSMERLKSLYKESRKIKKK